MQRDQNDERARSSVILIATVLVVLAFLFSYTERTAQLFSVRAQLTRHQDDIAWAKQWNLQLQDELHYYQSPEYVAEIARSELGFVQPGDDVYVVLPDPNQTAARSTAAETLSLAPAASDTQRSSPLSIEWWYAIFR